MTKALSRPSYLRMMEMPNRALRRRESTSVRACACSVCPVRLPSLPEPRQSQRTNEMFFSSLYSYAALYGSFSHVVLSIWRAATRAHGCGNLNDSFSSLIVTAGPCPTDTFVRGDVLGRKHTMKHDVVAVASSDQEPTGNTSALAHHVGLIQI